MIIKGIKMINLIHNWCEGIIIAIILSVIIELLVPDGNNKKYVKIVIGIYIIFVIINPILELINYDFEFGNIFNIETEETSSDLNNNVKDVYILGIEQTIKQEIENLGYDLNYVNVVVDNNYESIQLIEIGVNGKINNTIVRQVLIGTNEESINEYNDIIVLLQEKYLVEKNNIIFK